jgi:photosystem II stability/assembly factor-like uncharacterized protein
MNKLRQDLREVFDQQQDALGDLSGPRERVLRGALENKSDQPIGRRTQWAAGIAAAVIAILLVVTFAYVRAGSWRQSLEHPVPAASPTATAKQGPPLVAAPAANPFPGLHRWDVDLVNSSTAWTLLTSCDGGSTTPCNYFVAATSNGGKAWSKPVPIAQSFDPRSYDAPRTIRFVNARDGFVYGGGGAYVTHDGGKTWAKLDLNAVFFNAITGRDQTVWAFTYPCPKGTYCPYEARLSIDGGRTWSLPRAFPSSFSPNSSSLFGTSGLFVSDITGQMVILSEGARSGRSINSQCGTTNYRSFVATSEGNELWELCLGSPKTEVAAGSPDPSKPPSMNATQTTADKVLYVSQDGGLSWSQTRGPLPMLGVSVSIVSTGPHQLLLGTDSTPILRSTDGAAHWSPVQRSPAGVQWIRFINLQTGWAMDRQGAIWSTTDGGLTWSKLPDF